jgi:hypothetical protein
MKHQATHDLFRYWNDLRGERTAPERNDVDPGAIRHILADTFMLDVDADRSFPFRLAGTRVNALFDAEQKGRSFLNLWRAEERRNVAGLLMTVIDGACPIVAGAVATPPGQSECAMEVLLLPMRHHGRTHSRIMGLVKTVKVQPWIGLVPNGPMSLRSLRILDADETDFDRPTGTVQGASHVLQKLARPRTIGKPVLRLVQGGASLPPVRSLARERLEVLQIEIENGHL